MSSKQEIQKNQTQNKDKKTKKKRRFWKIFFIAFFAIIFGVFGALGGIIFGWIQSAPSPDTIQIQPQNFTSTIVYEKNSNEYVEKELHKDENRIYVTLDEIPDYLEQAVIAVEDERFDQHPGIDIQGILRAVYTDIKTMSAKEGASTLTQQLVKNNVLKTNEKAMERKVKEMYLAYQIEKIYSKQEILEAYLNTMGLGNNVAGVQQASKLYFGKDVKDLSLGESTIIAGITQNPSKYSPFREDNAVENIETSPLRKRQITVLDRMFTQGKITKQQYDEALSESVFDEIAENKERVSQTSSDNSYFVDQVISDVRDALQTELGFSKTAAINMIFRGGIKIYSTIDKDMQKIVDQTLLDPNLYPPTWDQNRKSSIQHTEFQVDYEYKYPKVQVDGSVKKVYGYDNFIIHNPDNAEDEIKKEIAKKQIGIEEKVLQQLKDLNKNTVGIDLKLTDVRKTAITPQPQVAVAIVDPYTGYVRALAGGKPPKLGSMTLNRATSSNRSPGSTIKPIGVYGPVMEEENLTPATIFNDRPIEIVKYGTVYRPKNASRNYLGSMTMREAIQRSQNIPAVLAMQQLGVSKSKQYLKKMNLTQIDQSVSEALALGGGAGISPLQMASAYGTFVNNGMYIKPTTFYKVVDRQGKILLEVTPHPVKVFSKQTAYLVTDMMKDVIAKKPGTATRARFTSIRMDQAGKTGTTTGNTDKWFAGITPYYSAAVWMGYDNNKEMDATNYHYHLVIWKEIMQAVHRDLPSKTFKEPSNIVHAKVCSVSGQLATEACTHAHTAYSEIFLRGTVPSTHCTYHKKAVPKPPTTEDPNKPGEGMQPADPTAPTTPGTPTAPTDPTTPGTPTDPTDPTTPDTPTNPGTPGSDDGNKDKDKENKKPNKTNKTPTANNINTEKLVTNLVQ